MTFGEMSRSVGVAEQMQRALPLPPLLAGADGSIAIDGMGEMSRSVTWPSNGNANCHWSSRSSQALVAAVPAMIHI